MIDCIVPTCDKPATHKLVHVPCGYGTLICGDHAGTLLRSWSNMGETIVRGPSRRCVLCNQRLTSAKDIIVVELSSTELAMSNLDYDE